MMATLPTGPYTQYLRIQIPKSYVVYGVLGPRNPQMLSIWTLSAGEQALL